MASLVTAGIEVEEGSWKHFKSIPEAQEGCAELRYLMSEANLLPSTLFSLLVNKHKIVKYKRPDQKSRHAPSTLRKRQDCSAVWAGTKPWLTVDSPTRSQVPLSVQFDWDWYSHFTFMIDAVQFEDSEPATAAKSERVFSLNYETWPPHLVPSTPRIDSTNRAMFYIVLHPHEGIVLGPDLVSTGSRVPAALLEHKDDILKPWCACSAKQHCVHNSIDHAMC